MSLTTELSTQQQYQLYGELCDACDEYKNLSIDEIDRLLSLGVCAANPQWEADHNRVNCLHSLIGSARKLSFEQFTQAFNRLCEAGADPKQSKANHGSLLTDAIRFGYPRIAAWLIDEKGLDVNSRNRLGNTPLFDAILSRHGKEVELVKVLLARGANPLLRNKLNKLPYELASPDVQKLLPTPQPTITQEQAWQKKAVPPTLSFSQGFLNLFKQLVPGHNKVAAVKTVPNIAPARKRCSY